MTRALAQDALRYISRTYADDAGHNRKMYRRHGGDWTKAKIIAADIYTACGTSECMAVLQSMVERAICGKGNGGEPV